MADVVDLPWNTAASIWEWCAPKTSFASRSSSLTSALLEIYAAWTRSFDGHRIASCLRFDSGNWTVVPPTKTFSFGAHALSTGTHQETECALKCFHYRQRGTGASAGQAGGI